MHTVAFLCLFAALHGLWSWARGSALERAVIDTATVRSAAMLVNWLTPEIHAYAEGSRIKADGGGINILNGCEGTDVLFLLLAAMLAVLPSWRKLLYGMACGALLIFLLNQVRILALFYANRLDRAWFDALHGILAPVVMIVAAGVFFLFWLEHGKADAMHVEQDA